MLWVQDEAAPGGGWRIDLRAGQTASAGGHTYALTPLSIFGFGGGDYGFFGSLMLSLDGSGDLLQFDLHGRLSGVGDLPDGGPGYGRGYRYDALLTRKWCSCVPAYSSDDNCCQTCGGETYRYYQVTRSGDFGKATYSFVADEPPRGCGSGVDLVEMEFDGI
jgi:hypothetical protein